MRLGNPKLGPVQSNVILDMNTLGQRSKHKRAAQLGRAETPLVAEGAQQRACKGASKGASLDFRRPMRYTRDVGNGGLV